MKKIYVFAAIIFVLCSSNVCGYKNTMEVSLKGKLVIKEICGHYVIQVIEGNLDSSFLVNAWRDDKRNKTFDKVFTVANACDFPAKFNEGDEFNFYLTQSPAPQACIFCMAFYPTPSKRNAIIIK